MRSIKLLVPLFNNGLILYDVNSKGFQKVGEKHNVEVSKTAGAYCFEKTIKGRSAIFIIINRKWFLKEDLAGTIAHEVVHAVNYLFLQKGIMPDRYNDETQAYLTGWIVRECHRFFKPKKSK